jgi:integrase/recombinase XerD
MKTIFLNEQTIGLKSYYYVRFDFDRLIYLQFRALYGCHFDQNERCWVVDLSLVDFDTLKEQFRNLAEFKFLNERIESVEARKARLRPIDFLMPLNPRFEAVILSFDRYLKSKRYSERTVEVYCDALRVFFRFIQPEEIREITNEDLIRYNNDYILKNNFSQSYQNQVVNAIKLFFGAIYQHKMDLELVHRPRREKKLPNVLSKEEVKLILNATTNLKHRMMLSLIYACGLRRSELLNLIPSDISADRGLLLIRQSKGKKDRVVPLSSKLLMQLREYYKLYRPHIWLFEGDKPKSKYGERSLQLVLKRSLSKTKIDKDVTLHWLRHSYATHLMESGTDLRFIQELLGHSSSKTTEIYTHVSTKSIQNIRSPFDEL